MKRTLHKALSLLLTAAMVLNMGLTSVFAAEAEAEALPGFTDSGEPAELVCACPPVDSGEPAHSKDCPLFVPVLMAPRAGKTPVDTADEFKAAIAAVTNGGTIQLTDSFTMNEGVTIEKKITLDLNGKKITFGDNFGILVSSGGELILSGGTVENNEGSTGYSVIKNSGTLRITGGEVKATGPSTYALQNLGNGSITVGDGAKIFGEGSAIAADFASDGTITVEGNATVTATNAIEYGTAISNMGTGTVNIEGGTVQNTAGGSVVYNNSTGTINVRGGEIISPGLDGGVPAAAINNISTGTINVTGGKLTAKGNGNGYAIRNDAGGNSNPASTVNITGGELLATGENGTAIFSNNGTLTVGRSAQVSATGNGGTAITNYTGDVTVTGSATVKATGGTATGSDGNLYGSKAIDNRGTLTVGGAASVRATKDMGAAVTNSGTFTLEDDATLEATGNAGAALTGGSALVNGGTAIINGGTVHVTEPGGVAVYNIATLDISGGVVGRVELNSISGSSPTTYVHSRTEAPAAAMGVPVLIGNSGYRIEVTLPDETDIANMLNKAASDGATPPDASDPLGFFELKLQTSNGGSTTLPTGMQLMLPFPAGADDESNNYKIAHFENTAAGALEVLDASGRDGGIICTPTSLSPFMPVKFARHQVTLDANGGEAITPSPMGVKLGGKLDLEKYGLTDLPTPTHSDNKFNGWYTEQSGGTKVTADYTYSSSSPTTIYAQWTSKSDGGGNGDGGGDGGGNDSDSTNSDAYDFWMRVKDKINAAESGDVVNANARAYNEMPVSVMDALRKNSGVTLVISWNGGKDITIPAGKAQKPEADRVYYPLSLLAKLYTDVALVEMPVGDKLNPETGGGIMMVDAPTAPPAAPDIPTMQEVVTAPDKGFEKEAFAGTPDAKNAEGGNGALIAAITAMLAVLCGGGWFWNKKRQDSAE